MALHKFCIIIIIVIIIIISISGAGMFQKLAQLMIKLLTALSGLGGCSPPPAIYGVWAGQLKTQDWNMQHLNGYGKPLPNLKSILHFPPSLYHAAAFSASQFGRWEHYPDGSVAEPRPSEI